MFAPPIPAPYAHGSRPSSAAGHHPHSPASTAPATPFDVPRGHGRRSSQSWSHSTSLPPPPSEIDKYADISSALITSASPSKYDMEFGTGLTAGLDAGHDGDRKQLPMNAVSKHPKLKLEVVLTSNVFEAGGSISGRLEVTSSTSKGLRLGELAVELEGIEGECMHARGPEDRNADGTLFASPLRTELSSRDHAATQTFLYNRTLFQGEHLPPSNAVLPSAPMSGYWTARKGRTTFPFSFKLPSSAPSCVTFAGNASLRYGLKATAQTWWADQKSIVTSRRDAFVVERWEDEFDEKFQQPVEAVGDTRLFMGGAGAIWLEAGVAEQLFWGGGQVVIRCGVKNNTKRQVSGIKVALARRLVFPVGADMGGRQSLEPQITEVVHEQNFKGREYEFPPNEELVCNVAVEVPRDLRTVRKTRLFEIRVVALVSLVLGTFA